MADESKTRDRIVPGRFQKGQGGRPPGIPNKTTRAAKEAISEAFEKLGGVPALVEWAQRNEDNERVFYSSIWTKIVPIDTNVSGKLAVTWPLPKSALDAVQS